VVREDFVVGLDIGTTKICTIVGKKDPKGQIKILGLGHNPSWGLRKGMVVDLECTAQSITKAVEAAEAQSGIEITGAYAGIAGGHIEGLNRTGAVAVAQPDREITKKDVERAINAAQVVAISPDREVIHVIPQEFTIDAQDGIKEPVGMSGVRLEARVHIVTGAVAAAQNIIKSVNRAGFRVEDIILQPLASAEAVLTPEEKELGVVLVDIGGGTSDITLFLEGNIWHTAVLSVGGAQVTNDIAVGISTPRSAAEKIKKEYGSCLTSSIGTEEMVCIPGIGGRKDRLLKRQVLSAIIQPRMEEIFSLVSGEIKKTGYEDLVNAGVVITGGASLMEGTVELAQQVLGLPVRLGYPQGVQGLNTDLNSPIYATGIGLVMLGLKYRAQGQLSRFTEGNLFSKVTERMKGWLKEFF
jgi:cell division protein FtsA